MASYFWVLVSRATYTLTFQDPSLGVQEGRLIQTESVRATPGGAFTFSFVINERSGELRIHGTVTFVVSADGMIRAERDLRLRRLPGPLSLAASDNPPSSHPRPRGGRSTWVSSSRLLPTLATKSPFALACLMTSFGRLQPKHPRWLQAVVCGWPQVSTRWQTRIAVVWTPVAAWRLPVAMLYWGWPQCVPWWHDDQPPCVQRC